MPSQIFVAESRGAFHSDGFVTRCVLGKAGVIDAGSKVEGDNKSPLGDWPLRFLFYRPDRVVPPQTALDCLPLSPRDGWCDDPSAPHLYNRHIKLPCPYSHEVLWRDDHVYDYILVLGHNDDPPIPGRGSAIFMHLTRADNQGTEGCVALSRRDFLRFIALARPNDILRISA